MSKIGISDIETYLVGILDKKVSSHTFAGTLPDTTPESWKDMVLVDCGSIADMDAFNRGTALIWLYAKPLTNGSKNVAKMKEMESKLNEVIESANDKSIHINREEMDCEYDSSRKWHCNIIGLNIKIY